MRVFFDRHLPKIVLSPTVAAALVFVYGFILWTIYVSLTNSRLLPVYEFVGFGAYVRLWENERWHVAIVNLGIFGALFIGISLALGLLLAILLDQRIRAEGVIRTIYLYPMALSFIVTGAAWRWILTPGLGVESLVRSWGWESFTFDWLVNPDYAIYTVVIAGVWQSSGFVMAMFLAGLRGVDSEILKAAAIDGAGPIRTYWKIVIPSLKPVFFSAIVVLAHIAVKSFDLVVALTGGGPGYASDLPATYMYAMTFQRSQINLGAASAVMMLMGVMAIIVPYLYSELRARKP